jgi:hypothetical protein
MDTSQLAFPKGPSRGLEKHRKRVANAARLAEAYRDVDLRDGGFSVVSGVFTVPFSSDPKRRREHHHLKGRRVRPEWVFRSERIITVTAFEHDLITSGALHVEGDDARKPLFFHWNPAIVKGKAPFRLKGPVV